MPVLHRAQCSYTLELWVGFRWKTAKSGKAPAHTLHLDQELRLDPSGGLTLIFIPRPAEGIHLINEDDGRLVLPGQLKQVLD